MQLTFGGGVEAFRTEFVSVGTTYGAVALIRENQVLIHRQWV